MITVARPLSDGKTMISVFDRSCQSGCTCQYVLQNLYIFNIPPSTLILCHTVPHTVTDELLTQHTFPTKGL